MRRPNIFFTTKDEIMHLYGRNRGSSIKQGDLVVFRPGPVTNNTPVYKVVATQRSRVYIKPYNIDGDGLTGGRGTRRGTRRGRRGTRRH
jgi:hypothetical protein